MVSARIATPIHLRGWSRWPEILWRRSSTRGLLVDQLRARDAAATIYAAGAVTRTVPPKVLPAGRRGEVQPGAGRDRAAPPRV